MQYYDLCMRVLNQCNYEFIYLMTLKYDKRLVFLKNTKLKLCV